MINVCLSVRVLKRALLMGHQGCCCPDSCVFVRVAAEQVQEVSGSSRTEPIGAEEHKGRQMWPTAPQSSGIRSSTNILSMD